jgi:transposase
LAHLDLSDATFACPDLTKFCRLDELGLAVTGQRLRPDRAVLACRAIHGHRGMKNDPLYSARRTLHTGAELLIDKQTDRLAALFDDDAHVEVEATWGIYHRMIEAYREQDRGRGRELMVKLIDSINHGVPKPLTEVITLGRTLKKRAADVLAYFDRPGTSNGPTEAINGRLEHLRGSALGFRNLTSYIARSLLETGGFRPQLHPHL